MKYISVLFLLFLFGCPAKIQPVVEIAPGAYAIAVTSGKIEIVPGKEEDKLLAEITVPPSDKPTKLKIYKAPKKLFPGLNTPKAEVVSDNKAVTVKQERHMPWWWKALMVIGAAILAKVAFGRYFSIAGKFLGGAWSLITRIFKK